MKSQNIKPEKPNKHAQIKDAASILFAHYGYQKTSIDDIVKQSGVSKGLYYYYYPDKRTLYLELYDLYLNAAMKDVNEKIDTTDPDFFSRYSQINKLKIALLEQMPHALNFLLSAYYETDVEVAAEIKRKNKKLAQQNHDIAFKGIDSSVFPDEESMQRMTEIIIWISEGFVKKITAQPSSPKAEDYLEFESYLDLLRCSVGQTQRTEA